MERAFWSRGIMEAIGLNQAICVVGRETEEEHRIAAHKMSVVLVSANEFRNLGNTLLGKTTPADLKPYYEANLNWLQFLKDNQSPLANFLLRENWAREWDRIPVTLPAQLRRMEGRFDPSKPIHQFAFFEIGILLALGLVRMASYMALTRPNNLPSAVNAFVLGGGSRAKLIESLLKRVDELGARADIQPTLLEVNSRSDTVVPYFPELLDITSRLVMRAGAARYVPRYI